MSQNNLLEYPEHLNPFKSRRSSMTKSFRKVFRSFTGKDKQRPPQHVDIQQNRHTFQPAPLNQNHQNRASYTPAALPRSRFKERLEKTENLKKTFKEKHWYNEESDGANPFEEDEAKATVAENLPPIPSVRSKYRKKKKRAAPLPPGMTMGDGQYLDVPSRNGSKWSLTSTDTDVSSLCISEYEEHEHQPERNDEILEITRKIAELTDDTLNNNHAVAGEVTIHVEEVDSSPHEKKREELETPKTIVEEDESTPIEQERKEEVLRQEEDVKQQEEDVKQPEEDMKQSEEDVKQPEEDVKQPEEDVKRQEEDVKQQEDKEDIPKEIPKLQEKNEAVIEENINVDEVVETSKIEETSKVEESQIIKEEKPITNGCVKNVDCDTQLQNVDHNQNSVLRVRIIDNQEVVLRHPEKYYEDTERYSIRQKIEQFESYNSSPSSKIRQTILTKEKLLGTE